MNKKEFDYKLYFLCNQKKDIENKINELIASWKNDLKKRLQSELPREA